MYCEHEQVLNDWCPRAPYLPHEIMKGGKKDGQVWTICPHCMCRHFHKPPVEQLYHCPNDTSNTYYIYPADTEQQADAARLGFPPRGNEE